LSDTTIRLPTEEGLLVDWRPSGAAPIEPDPGGFRSRVAYAATHVVLDPVADPAPGESAPIDWEATMAFRRHIWAMGLGVAEAMDTAQRGTGLDWQTARELIRRTIEEAATTGGRLVCGAGTDQLPPDRPIELSGIVDAYREQVEYVENLGGRVILMASRTLAAIGRSPDDYLEVYGQILSDVAQPVMIHWLGEVFDPALSGYWGSTDHWTALGTLLELASRFRAQIDGVKVSLLNDQIEIALRRGVPEGIRVYTGDDLNYPDLILGDSQGHSDALLGVFDAIAPAAASALQALDRSDLSRYRDVLESTLPLAHHLFEAPTPHYKTGLVFVAYLNGWQSHFRMVGDAETDRSLPHLARILVLSDQAGLLTDPEQAAHRMRLVLAPSGIE
jgi:hypothetical protein